MPGLAVILRWRGGGGLERDGYRSVLRSVLIGRTVVIAWRPKVQIGFSVKRRRRAT